MLAAGRDPKATRDVASHGTRYQRPTAGQTHAKNSMVGVLILTHGGLGPELLESARVISGRLESFVALPLEWTDGLDEAHQKLEAALRQVDHSNGVLILTDILGGTPFNVAMAFRQPGRVEIVTGVNLPMVVRLGCLLNEEKPLTELATWICDKGRASICAAKDLPRAGGSPPPPVDCEDAS